MTTTQLLQQAADTLEQALQDPSLDRRQTTLIAAAHEATTITLKLLLHRVWDRTRWTSLSASIRTLTAPQGFDAKHL